MKIEGHTNSFMEGKIQLNRNEMDFQEILIFCLEIIFQHNTKIAARM